MPWRGRRPLGSKYGGPRCLEEDPTLQKCQPERRLVHGRDGATRGGPVRRRYANDNRLEDLHAHLDVFKRLKRLKRLDAYGNPLADETKSPDPSLEIVSGRLRQRVRRREETSRSGARRAPPAECPTPRRNEPQHALAEPKRAPPGGVRKTQGTGSSSSRRSRGWRSWTARPSRTTSGRGRGVLSARRSKSRSRRIPRTSLR